MKKSQELEQVVKRHNELFDIQTKFYLLIQFLHRHISEPFVFLVVFFRLEYFQKKIIDKSVRVNQLVREMDKNLEIFQKNQKILMQKSIGLSDIKTIKGRFSEIEKRIEKTRKMVRSIKPLFYQEAFYLFCFVFFFVWILVLLYLIILMIK